MTPTARSLALLARDGWLCAPVERWLPYANVRKDLWGFGDVLACHPRDGLFLIVQSTSADHVAHRLAKARGRPELALWLKAGGAFQVHGWAKRDGRWRCRVVEVRAWDLQPVEVQSLPRRRRRGRQRLLFE